MLLNGVLNVVVVLVCVVLGFFVDCLGVIDHDV